MTKWSKTLKICISEHIGVKPKIKKEHPVYVMPEFTMVEREIVFVSQGNSPNNLFEKDIFKCFSSFWKYPAL